MRMLRVVSIITLVLLVPVGALATTIGLFSDSNCGSCNLALPVGQSGAFYVMVTDVPPLSYWYMGILEADFRIEGLPAGWTTVAQPSPAAATSVGDPMSCGALVTFGSSQRESCVLLYTITVTATTQLSDVLLGVATHCHSLPGCPNVVYHSFDDWNACAAAGHLHINSSEDCVVAVKSNTWSEVRSLYR